MRSASRTFFDSSRFSYELAEWREERAEILCLLFRLVQLAEKRGELSARDVAPVGNGPRQRIDAMLEPKALGVELQGLRVAVCERRLHFLSRQPWAFVARVQERTNPMHEVEVVGGHDVPIMVRRTAGELWAARPIFSSRGPRRT